MRKIACRLFGKILVLIRGEFNVYQLKQLDWHNRDDGVVHADPIGLRYAYYITLIESTFELALIENDGQYDEKMCTTHSALNEAQQHAQQHLENILRAFLIR
ncbi:MAG: hypothetical protein K2P99_01960 [Burkholderiales bacterium]|nr:hypothetical protein [Burkholderiales bacterium]